MATADGDALRAWIDGADIPFSDVRQMLHAVAVQCAEAAQSVVPAGVDPAEAIDHLAATMAARRANAIVPRVVRMPFADRIGGYGYFLAMIAGPDSEIERRHEDARHLERMMGLRTGHAGGLAEAASLRLDPQDLAPLRASGLADAIAGSTDDELELTRIVVQTFRFWLPFLLQMLSAHFGAKGVGMEKLVRHVYDQSGDLSIELPALILLLSRITTKDIPRDTLREVTRAIASGGADLELLELLPESQRQAAFDRLPQQRREALLRRRSDRTRLAQSQQPPPPAN